MNKLYGFRALALLSACALGAFALAQAPSRGNAVVFPVLYDGSGSPTSRMKAAEALGEILRKGGFGLVDAGKAATSWKNKKYRTATHTRPAKLSELTSVGKAVGAKYVLTAYVHFHTRSIWVNLGPKTISNCDITVTIVDSTTGKLAYEGEGSGRSDEKSQAIKVAGALLISPLVTAVSGGPKTPQETRAAQIAAARAMENFIVVK